MLKRKIETVLKTWKNTPGHKPLLATLPGNVHPFTPQTRSLSSERIPLTL